MIDIKVVGHKIPDTDCTLAAIIFADFLNKKNIYSAKAYIQGKLNKETEYLLDLLKIETPEIADTFPAGTKVALVDHNEDFQTLTNIKELEVEFIVDHHKIDFASSAPLNIRIEPICSTCSILYKMYLEAGFEIDKKIGTMMLAGILSDSLLFKSATTTKVDVEIAEKLKEITGISDLEAFAMPMFDAKSDLGDMDPIDLIKYDYKEFDFSGTKAGVGTLETTNPNYALGRKDEILKAMQTIKDSDKLDFIFLSIVDIIGEKNISIVLDGADSKVASEVFGAEVKDNLIDLKRRLSRKKQVIPDLTEYFLNK
ncbi:MAG: manganese-dependent inorganic pyrophosphatase [Candidatus Gracilibacteria bacterium]|nr:manganese-dependent inorganic pyrophosphatase [Candidatus Gracilibacteria bacterium]